MSTSAEVLTGLDQVERLLPEWRVLAASAARSPLEAPDWLLPLAQRYLTGEQVRFLAWRREGRLIGVAPLSLIGQRPPIRPVRQLALWGTVGPRMRGLVDVVAVDDERAGVLHGLAAWLANNREWDCLRLLRPQYGSATPEVLRQRSSEAHWAYVGYSNLRSTTYQLDLPPTIDEWEHHLRPKTRARARREARHFEADLGGQLVPVLPDDQLAESLDAVQRLLAARWGESEVYFASDPNFRGLIHEAVPALAARGDAWVSVARDTDGIHACLVTIAQHGYAMALLVAAADDAMRRKYSLGKHVFKMGIGEAVRRGCHTYDFLWVGDYKESFWHARPRFLESAMVGRGLVGRLGARLLARREGDAPVGQQG